MTRYVNPVVVLALTACLGGCARITGAPANIPPPMIPDKTFNIVDYGAVGDGKTLNALAITRAIEACRLAGGGRVVVPAGRFVSEPFSLVSNCELHLEKDAVLLAINDIDRYPAGDRGYRNWLTAEHCHDVAITGQGMIDGQGQPWWDKYRKKKDLAPGEKQPHEIYAHRPYMVVFKNCQRVRVEGVTLTNAQTFHLVPEACRDVVIENIRVISPDEAPNTDGIDASGWNILISGCYVSVGDDNIVLKPSGARGPKGELSCENITIENCTLGTGHGLSIGGQTNGGLRNMIVRNCTFDGTEAGIRMKAGRGSGGLVEKVCYENLKMRNVKVAIFITSYYPRIPQDVERDPPQPVNARTPIYRNIRISSVTAEGGETAGRIVGLPEMWISDISLKDVHISAEKPMEIVFARGIRFVNSRVAAETPPPVIVKQAKVSGLNPATGK